MQTALAILIVLLAAAYLLRAWLPVMHAKSNGLGSQRTGCGPCTACEGYR